MVKKTITGPIDCACVIHGTAYSWNYVERLHSMLSRHISPGIRLHVYTEAARPVPEPMIKHVLEPWPITNPKKSWWYKMQLFNPEHHAGPMLYFDLDVVIVGNLDWIWQQSPSQFYAIRDFKHLWRPTFYGINSSVMWWDTQQYARIWEKFKQQNLEHVMKKHHGDQDYITEEIPMKERRFFDSQRVQSWRWQLLDGGYNFVKKQHHIPGSGTQLLPSTSILVFHGNPKPAQITDPVVQQHWQ
jgi:hypothetical protein